MNESNIPITRNLRHYYKRFSNSFRINFIFLSFGLLCFVYTDIFILPSKIKKDTIININKEVFRNGDYVEILGYRHFTKGKKIFMNAHLLETREIELYYSPILGLMKDVREVSKPEKTNRKYLSNGLTPFKKYFSFILFISNGIGIYFMLSKRKISENTYYNIVYFNLIAGIIFLLFIVLY